MHPKRILPIIVILALISGGAYWYFTRTASAQPGALTASGTIETTAINVSPEVGGRVMSVAFQEGDAVKAGQLVAKEDDTEELAAVEFADSQATDTTRVTAQEKVRDQKKKVYERKRDSGAVNATEVEEALLDWEVGNANVILSQFEHLQDGRKAKQARATLEKTRLYTPIAGVVEQSMVKVGENVDNQNMKVMRIVNINPLWVEVPVPFTIARTLKNTDTAKVVFTNKEVRTAKVIHVASVADAASDTLLVRVEVENAAKTPAGERVIVSFNPAAKVAAGDAPQ